MKSISLALTAVASLAAAVPQYGNSPPSNCISQSDAQTLVARYAAVIAETSSDLGSAVKTAKAITAQGYTEQSDSANIELGIPVGRLAILQKASLLTAYDTSWARSQSLANMPLSPSRRQTRQLLRIHKISTWLAML
jgi:hypothetical protein